MSEAQESALRVLDFLEPEDEISLNLTTEKVEMESAFSTDRALFRRAVNGVEQSDKRGDLITLLSSADELLARSGQPNREIIVISDMQSTAFETQAETTRSTGACLKSRAAPLPQSHPR